jgi:pyruvate dehydrogenase E2 component (dihydrolipoamide acetyltransferase)
MEDGFLREWHVKPGDRIRKGDIIADVETQKGIIEIEVFDEGTIGELLVQVDEKVPVGTVMATILPAAEAEAAARVPAPAAGDAPAAAPAAAAPPLAAPATAEPHQVRASPLARRIAAEKGIDLATVRGSGPEGAITREDVEQALAAQAAPLVPAAPAPRQPAPPGVSTESIRQAVAAAMSKSNREVPHYYLATRIDMSRALAWLAEANQQRPVKERLLPAVLLIKAVAKALAEVPDLNAWWDNGLQRKADIHIGYVVALRTGGIMVPTLHHAGNKTPEELMQALTDLIPRARALRLRSSELADSTITVTSLGEGAVETVFGVIYPPQVALVGFGGIAEQPWAEKGMLNVRPVLVATLAADHRATDGNTGSRFLAAIKNHLQQPEQL